MSQSDEDKTSAKPTKKVIDINDLIPKPDPFANGMVVKKKWSEGNHKNICRLAKSYIQILDQTDKK